jgi:hypothetical protein
LDLNGRLSDISELFIPPLFTGVRNVHLVSWVNIGIFDVSYIGPVEHIMCKGQIS